MISFKDFIKKVTKVSNVSFDLNYYDIDTHLNDIDIEILLRDNKIDLDKAFISTVWLSGGIYGNDCYEYLNKIIEPESEVDVIPKIVELLLYLEISNIDYSEICCMVEQHNFLVDVDYYYNHFEYSRNFVNLKNIYEKFIS